MWMCALNDREECAENVPAQAKKCSDQQQI